MSRISHITLTFLALTVLAYSANIVWGQAQQSTPTPTSATTPSGIQNAQRNATSANSVQQNTVSSPSSSNTATVSSSGNSLSNSTFNSNFRRDAQIGPNGQQLQGTTVVGPNGHTRTVIIGAPNNGFVGGTGFNNGFVGGTGFNNGFIGNGIGLVPNGITSSNTNNPGIFANGFTNNGGMSEAEYNAYTASLMLQGGVSTQQGAAPSALGLYPTSSQVSGHVFTGALGEQTTMYPADFLHRTGTLGPLSQQEAAAWNKMNNNRQVYGPQSLMIGSQSEMKPTVVATKDVLVDGIPQRVSGTIIQEIGYAPEISTASFERERAYGRQLTQRSLNQHGITTVAEKNAYVRFRSALTRKNHY